MDLWSYVRDVPDHPKPGVVFKDLTPLFADGAAFHEAIRQLAAPYAEGTVDTVAGVEARGFLLAAPIAYLLGAGVVPIRKPGKLPGAVHERSYDLEYGSSTLAVHRDAFAPGERVLLVDDVLATGGTAAAAGHLVEHCGAELLGIAFLLELSFLGGRAALAGTAVHTVLTA